MATDELPFDKLIEEMGLAAKWRAQGEVLGEALGEARGEKTGWEKALEFLKQGHTVEDLERMVSPAPGEK
jgi:hypothetical protein